LALIAGAVILAGIGAGGFLVMKGNNVKLPIQPIGAPIFNGNNLNGENKIWVKKQLTQCAEKWNVADPNNDQQIKDYFANNLGVEVFDIKRIFGAEESCKACTCLSGLELKLQIQSKDSSKLSKLGYSLVEAVKNPPTIDLAKYRNVVAGKHQYVYIQGSVLEEGQTMEMEKSEILILKTGCTGEAFEFMGKKLDVCGGIGLLARGECKVGAKWRGDCGCLAVVGADCRCPEAKIAECLNDLSCGFLENESIKLMCEAITQNDYRICDNIGDEKFKSNCYQIIIDLAKPEDYSLLCKQMAERGRADKCYSAYSVKATSPAHCQEIESIGNDKKNNVSEYYAKECYSRLALQLNDSALCKKAGSGSNCAFTLAKTLNDSSLCPLSNNHEGCVDQLVAANPGNTAICDKIGDIGKKDECLIELAAKTGDPGICSMVTKYKSSCYIDMAVGLADASLCDKIGAESDKKVCKGKMFYYTGDKLLCDWTEDPVTCSNSSVKVENIENGKRITVSYQKDGQAVVHIVELTPNPDKKIYDYMEREDSQALQN